MALDEEAVRRDLRSVLTVLPAVSNVAWAYQNQKFTVGSSTIWIRETLLNGGESATATGFTQVLLQGRYDVFVRSGTGTEAGAAIAKALLDALPVGTWRGTAPNQYHVYKAERVSLQQGSGAGTSGVAGTDSWVFHPVIFYLRAHAPRPQE